MRILTRVDANGFRIYRRGCEQFLNFFNAPYSAFAPPVLEGYGRSLRRTFLNQESVRRTRRAANRFLMPSEHFKSPFERAIATTLKIYSGINRNANIRRDSSAIHLQRFVFCFRPFLPQFHDHPYRLRGASPLTAPGDTNVSAHLVMVWATCISSLVYMWSAFSIMTVSTRLGPLD